MDIRNHKYYGPLLESYARSIFTSGLLLDEDLEALLTVCNLTDRADQGERTPSVRLAIGFLSVLGTTFLARRCEWPLLMLPPFLYSVRLVTSEIQYLRTRRKHKELFTNLITVIKKIHKLNTDITRYVNTRADLGKTGKRSFALSNRSTEEFTVVLSASELDLLEITTGILSKMSALSGDLTDDYDCLKSFDFASVVEDAVINNVEDCLAFIQTIQDIHVLLASKLLSYAGILFYSKNSDWDRETLTALLNADLPTLSTRLRRHYDHIKKQFDSLRYSLKKKAEFKSRPGPTTRRTRISTRLQGTLVQCVNNLSVVLEKSQTVLERVDQGEDEIGDAIVDLRNHTRATYESLDVLCKLYGILANAPASENQVVGTKRRDVERNVPTVTYDDVTEPVEEKFELYVGEEGSGSDPPVTDFEEDQAGAYLSLMLRELQLSLKRHQRFIEAKERRGSVDDDRAAGDASKGESRQTEKQPPLPPPPPQFNLADLEEKNGQCVRSMLDNIKALSSQRIVQEEVFGGAESDSD